METKRVDTAAAELRRLIENSQKAPTSAEYGERIDLWQRYLIDHAEEIANALEERNRLRAAAQAVVAVADGDMNRELLDAIDALDAELEGSTGR